MLPPHPSTFTIFFLLLSFFPPLPRDMCDNADPAPAPRPAPRPEPTPSTAGGSKRRQSMIAQEELESTINFATVAVSPGSDWYPWCRDNGVYITREELLDLVAEQEAGRAAVVIADTRDDDVAGGMITDAIHTPDGQFNAGTILQLINAVKAVPTTSTTAPRVIVFHCMESARRGPRCCKRTTLAIEALTMDDHEDEDETIPPRVQVRVLAGGFDQWVRRYWQDPSKVRGYDDEYWGFNEFDPLPEALEEDAEEAKAKAKATEKKKEGGGEKAGIQINGTATQHPLYTRPSDQPATPWSAAGV